MRTKKDTSKRYIAYIDAYDPGAGWPLYHEAEGNTPEKAVKKVKRYLDAAMGKPDHWYDLIEVEELK